MELWGVPIPLSLNLTSAVGVTLALVAVTSATIYFYATRHFSHWLRKGVPYIKPLPFVGNIADVALFRKHIGQVFQEEYTKIKGQKYIGMYMFDQPVLFVRDINIWKNIMHKDFEHFTDRAIFSSKSEPIFHEALFFRKGKYWKELRTKLTPGFTSGKLKRFFVLLDQKASHLDHYFDDAVRDGSSRDVADACGRYTTDAVATIGFGIETSALTNKNDHLRTLLKNIFVYNKIHLLLMLATFVNPPVLQILRPSFVPPTLLSFVRSAVWSVIGERERAGSRGERGDFLDLLMELREEGSIAVNNSTECSVPRNGASPKANNINNGVDREKNTNGNNVSLTNGVKSSSTKSKVAMDGDILTAQAFTFFSAGFETSSTTMSFALYELAKNEEIQEELRTHLKLTVDDNTGKITYEALQSCTYLDMVLSETLRMYPILPFMDRVCTKTYRIPENDLIIEKGTVVLTSVLGIQRDPDLFPNPDQFDPRRFSEDNKSSIKSGSYFPFGDGPRICIGMRLGLLQAKLGLAHIILNYRLQTCAETPETMKYNLHSHLLQPENGVQVKFSRV